MAAQTRGVRRVPTLTSKHLFSPRQCCDELIIIYRPYVPPRTGWAVPSPLSNEHTASSQAIPSNIRQSTLSPIQASPTSARGGHRRNDSDYYEDVDPRFATEDRPTSAISAAPPSPVPNSLMPGGVPSRYPSPAHLHPNGQRSQSSDLLGGVGAGASTPSLERDSSYENIAEGARSPAGSDASHFTSVSQRGVNPNWRPPPGSNYGGSMVGGGPGPGNGGAAAARRNDVILNANPDFAIPGMGPPRNGGRGGMGPARGRAGLPSQMRGASGPVGLTPGGRYPSDI